MEYIVWLRELAAAAGLIGLTLGALSLKSVLKRSVNI